ncbi:hypothetical protein SCHPADRAFT_228863 [Schizopora paradoxa]|uniref:Uncharacterized protein n=1 Tax=Schizopora paradoxa TaxID=27342 RepID=A0A0H2RWV7_9AGAM|nr:hypothetical protein SCHPADRAFT_228863 [Schizopora paradoxa]
MSRTHFRHLRHRRTSRSFSLSFCHPHPREDDSRRRRTTRSKSEPRPSERPTLELRVAKETAYVSSSEGLGKERDLPQTYLNSEIRARKSLSIWDRRPHSSVLPQGLKTSSLNLKLDASPLQHPDIAFISTNCDTNNLGPGMARRCPVARRLGSRNEDSSCNFSL